MKSLTKIVHLIISGICRIDASKPTETRPRNEGERGENEGESGADGCRDASGSRERAKGEIRERDEGGAGGEGWEDAARAGMRYDIQLGRKWWDPKW